MRRAVTPPSIVLDEESVGSAATREEQPQSPSSIIHVDDVLAAPPRTKLTPNVLPQIPGSPPQLAFTRVTASYHKPGNGRNRERMHKIRRPQSPAAQVPAAQRQRRYPRSL